MVETLVYNYTVDNEYPPPMLQYSPVRWTSYMMSIVFLLFGARHALIAQKNRVIWPIGSSGASILLFISLIIRGSLGATSTSPFRLYETERVLHLCAGYMINSTLFILSSKWIEMSNQDKVGLFLEHLGIGYCVSTSVCTCIGIPLSFEVSETKRITGYKLVSISLIISIGGVLLAGLLAAYHTPYKCNARDRIVSIFIPVFLLVLWVSFELARHSLAPDNTANTSDAMFYSFSVIPLAGVLAIWAAVGEEYCQVVEKVDVESLDSGGETAVASLPKPTPCCVEYSNETTGNTRRVLEVRIQRAITRYA